MTPDALTPHFFTEFDKEARSRESIDPFYHDAVRLVEEYRAALNTITQQAQELERVKERLHRYNHWTPEHTIEEWLVDRQRIVDAKQVEADAQLQATLAASQARCGEMGREIESLTTCGCEGCDDNLEESAFCSPCMNKVQTQLTQLQATLAASQARCAKFEAMLAAREASYDRMRDNWTKAVQELNELKRALKGV